MLKALENSHRDNLTGPKRANGIIFIVFETIMSFISRMHIIGLVKQISFALERELRGVSSALLRGLLLRNPIVTVNSVKYYLSDARLESLVTLFADYEKYVWKYFRPVTGETFIDVGAHVGKYALQVAGIVGDNGSVIAIEPHPENYRALLKGIQLNRFKNVAAINVAAWNKDCKLRLFTHDAAVHHSTKMDLGLGYVEVEARALDHVIEELGLKHVDWIKIDVEDAEVEVLNGLKETLAKCAPRLIIEAQWKNLKEILKLMENHRYLVKPIEGEQNPKTKWGYFYCEPVST